MTTVDMTHDVVQIGRALSVEDRVHETAQLELDPPMGRQPMQLKVARCDMLACAELENHVKISTLPVSGWDESPLCSQRADGSGEDDVSDKSTTETLWKCVALLTFHCPGVHRGHERQSMVGSCTYRSESSSPGWTTLPDWTSIQFRKPQSCWHSVADNGTFTERWRHSHNSTVECASESTSSVGSCHGTECRRRKMRHNWVKVEQIDQVLSVWNKAVQAQNWALGNAAVDREIRCLPGSIDKWLGPVRYDLNQLIAVEFMENHLASTDSSNKCSTVWNAAPRCNKISSDTLP